MSLVTTQSALLTKECYLIDRIDNRNRDKIKHLKSICFLRPTRESLRYLTDELGDPAYGDYYLCKWENGCIFISMQAHQLPRIDFSNTMRKADIEHLAEIDEHEVVREVHVIMQP